MRVEVWIVKERPQCEFKSDTYSSILVMPVGCFTNHGLNAQGVLDDIISVMPFETTGDEVRIIDHSGDFEGLSYGTD